MARQNYNDIFNEEDSTSSNSNMEPTQAPHSISWEETKLEECKRRLEDVLDTFSKIDSKVSDLDGKISQLEKSASILHSSLESLKDMKELENELGNITVQIADKSYLSFCVHTYRYGAIVQQFHLHVSPKLTCGDRFTQVLR